MRVFLDATGLERQTEAPLQSRPAQGSGSRGGSSASSSTFGREQERRMAMGLPLLTQQFQGALG